MAPPLIAPKAPDFTPIPPEAGGNFCPFLAVNDLLQQQGPVDAKSVLANPGRAMQQAGMGISLIPNVLKCLGAACALWHAPLKTCSLKAAALAQIETAAALKSLALAGAGK